jgi:hypothetical protein
MALMIMDKAFQTGRSAVRKAVKRQAISVKRQNKPSA